MALAWPPPAEPLARRPPLDSRVSVPHGLWGFKSVLNKVDRSAGSSTSSLSAAGSVRQPLPGPSSRSNGSESSAASGRKRTGGRSSTEPASYYRVGFLQQPLVRSHIVLSLKTTECLWKGLVWGMYRQERRAGRSRSSQRSSTAMVSSGSSFLLFVSDGLMLGVQERSPLGNHHAARELTYSVRSGAIGLEMPDPDR